MIPRNGEAKIVPRLNKILKERGMTQNDLSNLTGITQPVISRFDKNGQHRSTHLYLIAKALDVKIDDLFEVLYSYREDEPLTRDSNLRIEEPIINQLNIKDDSDE